MKWTSIKTTIFIINIVSSVERLPRFNSPLNASHLSVLWKLVCSKSSSTLCAFIHIRGWKAKGLKHRYFMLYKSYQKKHNHKFRKRILSMRRDCHTKKTYIFEAIREGSMSTRKTGSFSKSALFGQKLSLFSTFHIVHCTVLLKNIFV